MSEVKLPKPKKWGDNPRGEPQDVKKSKPKKRVDNMRGTYRQVSER